METNQRVWWNHGGAWQRATVLDGPTSGWITIRLIDGTQLSVWRKDLRTTLVGW